MHNNIKPIYILLCNNKVSVSSHFCWFLYFSSSHRGFDIGNHFCEWMYDYDCDEFPYFSVNTQAYPSKAQQVIACVYVRVFAGCVLTVSNLRLLSPQLHFIEHYLRESHCGFDDLSEEEQRRLKEDMYQEVNRWVLRHSTRNSEAAFTDPLKSSHGPSQKWSPAILSPSVQKQTVPTVPELPCGSIGLWVSWEHSSQTIVLLKQF